MKKKTTYKEYTKKEVVTKNITLEGTTMLRAEEITSIFKVIREVNPITFKPQKIASKVLIEERVNPLEYPLTEVTAEELAKYRKSGVPSFVLKYDSKLYYTVIPAKINFVSSFILGEHQCSPAGKVCNRLSAAGDEKGGCAKVREHSSGIEKYPWIISGYETFNTRHDSFVVTSCNHYEKCPPRKIYTAAEIYNARLSLAQFVWDDVETMADVRRKKEKNKAYIGDVF